MSVFVVCFADRCDQRISVANIKAGAGRSSCYFAKRAWHHIVFTEYEFEDFEQCPPPRSEFFRHHDDSDHRHPRFADFVGEPVPEPLSLLFVRNEPRKKYFERLDFTSALQVRRRPVTVIDGYAIL